MNRNLHVERLYYLGDYRNIKFYDEINDLPPEIMFNQEIVEKLQFMQFVGVELAFRRYVKLNKTLPESPEDAIAVLEEVRVGALDELKNLLNGHLKQ